MKYLIEAHMSIVNSRTNQLNGFTLKDSPVEEYTMIPQEHSKNIVTFA